MFKRKTSVKIKTKYVFAEIDEKLDVACFGNMANLIANDSWHKSQKIQNVLLWQQQS